MRRAVVVLVSIVVAIPAPVRAAPPGDLDLLCGFVNVAYDVERAGADESMIAEIDGGPIWANGTMTCSVRVGSSSVDALHTAPDAAAASGTGSDGVTVVRPTVVAYRKPLRTNVWLCDTFTDASGTAYVFDDLDGSWEPAAGNDDATCRLALHDTGQSGGPLIAGWDVDPCEVDGCPSEVEDARSTVDAALCPDLGDEEDPSADGDVYVWFVRVWDCPPEDDQDLI